MGRGTTPIEAAIQGRRPVGNDINPLSPLLVRPRLNAPPLQDVAARLRVIPWAYEGEVWRDLEVFYHPDTLREISGLKHWLLWREREGALDAVDDWIRMVALNRLTGHSAGFFSVYTLPPNQAVSIEAQRRINAKRKQVPPYRNVADIILKKSRSLLGGAVFRTPEHLLIVGDACKTPQIESGSVDLVVTSPPFLDIVQYAQDNWLRCWFAQVEPASVAIAMHKKVADWQGLVRSAFEELERVIRPGGHVAFEVGEVRNGKIELEKIVLAAIKGLRFEPLCVLLNVQEFTKTANCWGVENNRSGTNTNRIVVAARH